MPTRVETVPLSEVARIVGCDERSVRRARDSGRIPSELFVRRGKTLKLRKDRLKLACECMADGLYGRPEADDGGEYSYSRERARREHYEAELSKLKTEQHRDSLIPTAKVQCQYTAAVRRVRERMLAVPSEVAAELVGLDPDAIRKRLQEAFRAALKQLQAEVLAGSPS